MRNVCVIGAGTMGSAIAAHLLNLGFRVTLLDQTRESVQDAHDRAKALRPPQFMIPERASEIRLGSIAENLDYIAEADWVCEAIVERLDAKRALYQQIEPLLKPEAMISTNTSGLQIELLSEGLSDSFRRRFLGTHFFNPPRYLKLLELIPTPQTDPAIVQAMTAFLESSVARRVVLAKDTPGFIANRYGMWSMFKAVHSAEYLGLSVEEFDLITGEFMGRPRSASFRLNDIVGLDVMRDIAQNLLDRCTDDPQIKNLEQPASLHALLARNWLGEKTGHGYYRREGHEFLALDLGTLSYRNRSEPNFRSITDLKSLPIGERLARGLEARDQVGEVLRNYLKPTLQYADQIRQEISHSVQDFDRVMQWGFGWELGPFGLIDAIGPDKLGIKGKAFYFDGKMLDESGGYSTIRNEPEFRSLANYPEVSVGLYHRIRDLGDGVLALCLTNKMGVISPDVVKELSDVLESASLHRFVFTSEGDHFSAGFDIKFLLGAIEGQEWQKIDDSLIGLQQLGELLEQRSAVAAVCGYCLGAGLELALSCSQIVAAAESKIGMPESRIGLIPGGRGTALMRLNNQATTKRLSEAAMTLARGVRSANAEHARQLGYLRHHDVTAFQADRLITDAKQAVLNAKENGRPAWKSEPSPLLGIIDREIEQAQKAGEFTSHDVAIANKIKQVFVKSTGYEDALVKERVEFLDLAGKALSIARMRHMLEYGKPLPN